MIQRNMTGCVNLYTVLPEMFRYNTPCSKIERMKELMSSAHGHICTLGSWELLASELPALMSVLMHTPAMLTNVLPREGLCSGYVSRKAPEQHSTALICFQSTQLV